ncbi:MAG: TIGR01620 family protein [Pseudomonadota bacterium]
MTTEKPMGPLIIEIDHEPLPDAPSPAASAQPVEPGVRAAGAAEQVIRTAARRRPWGLGRVALLVTGSLVALWIGIAFNDFVADLFTRSDGLGWLALGLLGTLVAVLCAVGMREIAALARLGRVESLRSQCAEALDSGSMTAGTAALDGLRALYRDRASLARSMGQLEEALADTPDPGDRLALAERELMAPLDNQAEAAVQRAARTVATATALIPLAAVDVLAALTCNIRMIREIAEIYGGRAGVIGSWRLMRAVAAHLVATGAVAVADDLIGPMIGGGVLAKLSRRFGEGVVNGTLTARVGVAAIEICRPMPFSERPAPKASTLVLGALKSWRNDDTAGNQGVDRAG